MAPISDPRISDLGPDDRILHHEPAPKRKEAA
jgi:hypothetical protein